MESSTKKGIRLANYQDLDSRLTSEPADMWLVIDDIVFEMDMNGIPIPDQEKYLNNLKEHVNVIVLNLYDAYLKDPERYVGYLRRRGAYKKERGYKGFQFSYQNVRKVTDFLEDKVYIEQDKGYPSSDKYKWQMCKMRSTAKLVELIERYQKITTDMIGRDTSHDEVIIVKGIKPRKRWRIIVEDGVKKKKKYQPPRKICKTPDNLKVRKMRENVQFINYIMEQSEITLDITDKELRELNRQLDRDDDKYKQAVDYRRKFLHRSFIDRKLDRDGRFYGPWYQGIPKEYRAKIMINGAPVVEVDYSGYHPRILYALKGLSIPEDPYRLTGYPETDVMRKFLKTMLLTIINAKDSQNAIGGMRDQRKKEHKKSLRIHGKKPDPIGLEPLTDAKYLGVMDKLMEKHKPISEYFFSTFGDTLRWYDSQIAEIIMLHFAYKGYPCLPVHDSFIVDVRLGDELEEIMEKVFVHNFKKKIPVDDNLQKYLFTTEFISKHKDEIVERISKGLIDGTIDKDEFEKDLKEQRERHKEFVRLANELKKSLDSK